MNSPSAAAVQRFEAFSHWLLVSFILLVVGAWSAWDVYIDYSQVMEQEYRLLDAHARQHEARISGALRSVDLMLGSIIDDLNERPTLSVGDQNRLLKNSLRQLPEIENLLVTDSSGRIHSDTYEKVIGLDVSHREYFKVHRDAPENADFHISVPFKSAIGRISTTESRVILDHQGRFAGVVAATLDARFFNRVLTLSSAESGGQTSLINRAGDILNMVPASDSIGKNLQGGVAFSEHARSGQATTRHLNTIKLQQVERMSVFHDLPGTPLTVIVSRDYDKVMAEWQKSLSTHIGGFLVMAFTTIFFSWLAENRQASLGRARQQIAASELELRTVIETEPDCVKQLSADCTLLTMNDAGLKMIEADSLDQVRGKNMQQLINPEYRKAFMALTHKVFAGESGKLEFEVRGLKGGARWLETHAVPLRDAHGNITSLLGITRDISAAKKSEADLSGFKAIVESTDDAIIGKSLEGIITSWNPGAERIFGYTAAEAIGNSMKMITPSDRLHEEPEILARISRGERIEHFETVRCDKAGRLIDISATISPILDAGGRVVGASKIARNITVQKQMQAQIRQLAFHDPLTKLPNRRLLNDRLNQVMAASKRTGCFGAVMFLDLDNFKPLNDTRGHEVGDLLLIEVSNRLTNCVREMDTVGRFGGDEFVVILSELNASKDASTTQAGIVAEKIRASLSEPYRLTITHDGKAESQIEHHGAASVGVALFIDHEASQDDIFKWADSAMYQAKEAGRNQVRFYEAKT